MCSARSRGTDKTLVTYRARRSSPVPMLGLRDSFGTWVYETYGVKQAQDRLGHGDPATTLRHYVRLTTAAGAKAVAGLDEVTRAALEAAQAQAADDATPALSNVVALGSRRR
jgi:integrase